MAATLVEVGAATWEAASVGAAASIVAAATAEALVATTVDMAAERTEAVITAARIPEVMPAEGDTVACIPAEALLLPGRGRGRVRARRGTLLRVGTDSQKATPR